MILQKAVGELITYAQNVVALSHGTRHRDPGTMEGHTDTDCYPAETETRGRKRGHLHTKNTSDIFNNNGFKVALAPALH